MPQTLGYRYLGYVKAQFPNALSLIVYLRHTKHFFKIAPSSSLTEHLLGSTLEIPLSGNFWLLKTSIFRLIRRLVSGPVIHDISVIQTLTHFKGS